MRVWDSHFKVSKSIPNYNSTDNNISPFGGKNLRIKQKNVGEPVKD